MGPTSPRDALLRSLPSIDELLAEPSLQPLLKAHPRPRLLRALRMAVQAARSRVLKGEPRGFEPSDVTDALEHLGLPNLRRVHNATGVVLHTNLGRAPLAERAIERMTEVARGYSNLEVDLASGARGQRSSAVVPLLSLLTGAEDALVVNNCAAAVLLVLSSLAGGRDAVVSRGELVEIGGGFRIPDVMRAATVTLREVGTTNRTRIADYEAAMTPETALLVKVHRSNFAQVGFTEDVSVEALAQLGRARGVPVFVDMGSGSLSALAGDGLTPEPTMRQVVEAGADVVAFSGDKLLGGPQAGVIVGGRASVERLAKHPLCRALRIDKLTLAALEATLELYRDGLEYEIPVRRLLLEPASALRARAQRLMDALAREGCEAHIEETRTQVGGGTMPLAASPSCGCVLWPGSEGLQAALRRGAGRKISPVVARVTEGRILLDVRCLNEDELGPVSCAVREARLRKAC